MFIAQHKLVMDGQKWTRLTAVAAILSALAALIMASLLWLEHRGGNVGERQQPVPSEVSLEKNYWDEA